MKKHDLGGEGRMAHLRVLAQPAASRWWMQALRRDPGLTLIVALFLLLLPMSTPRIYATDEVQYYAYLRSFYFDGDLDFRNEYTYFANAGQRNGDPAVYNALLRDRAVDPPLNPRTGKVRNVAPVGSALLWSPGFVLADIGTRIAARLGASIPADGYSWPYIWSACYMSAFYALLGLILTYRLARRYSSLFAATLATIVVWLATPLIFYSSILMPWSHATGFALFALFLTIWLRDGHLESAAMQRSLHTWMLLGLVGGLMTMTREQLGLLLLLPAVEGVFTYITLLRQRRWAAAGRLLLVHGAFLGAFAFALTPQLAAYAVLNGRPLPATTVSGKLDMRSPHFFDTLLDVHHGAFLWSPILPIGLFGLIALARYDRQLAGLLALGFVAQTYINGAFGTTWHLTGSFGFRRLIECTPIIVLGLTALLDRLHGRVGKAPLLLAAGVFIAWNAGLVLNWTVFNATSHLRDGLSWPDLWRFQLDAPLRAFARIGDLLFHRCRLYANGRC